MDDLLEDFIDWNEVSPTKCRSNAGRTIAAASGRGHCRDGCRSNWESCMPSQSLMTNTISQAGRITLKKHIEQKDKPRTKRPDFKKKCSKPSKEHRPHQIQTHYGKSRSRCVSEVENWKAYVHRERCMNTAKRQFSWGGRLKPMHTISTGASKAKKQPMPCCVEMDAVLSNTQREQQSSFDHVGSNSRFLEQEFASGYKQA